MIEGLVSIIMPSYNAARFIGESINSVLLQTYSNWELLIVDDCSKDNSVEVVRKFANIDKRVVLFSLEKNVGAAAARNVAIKNSKRKRSIVWIPTSKNPVPTWADPLVSLPFLRHLLSHLFEKLLAKWG